MKKALQKLLATKTGMREETQNCVAYAFDPPRRANGNVFKGTALRMQLPLDLLAVFAQATEGV